MMNLYQKCTVCEGDEKKKAACKSCEGRGITETIRDGALLKEYLDIVIPDYIKKMVIDKYELEPKSFFPLERQTKKKR